MSGLLIQEWRGLDKWCEWLNPSGNIVAVGKLPPTRRLCAVHSTNDGGVLPESSVSGKIELNRSVALSRRRNRWNFPALSGPFCELLCDQKRWTFCTSADDFSWSSRV